MAKVARHISLLLWVVRAGRPRPLLVPGGLVIFAWYYPRSRLEGREIYLLSFRIGARLLPTIAPEFVPRFKLID